MKFGISRIALAATLAGAVAPAALAQAASDNPFLRGRYVAVQDRAQPAYDPIPIRAGSFYVNSSLGLNAEYNDNVFAEDKSADPNEDTIIRIMPRVDANSNWSVHSLSAGLSLDHSEHLTEDTETVTDYRGYVAGRLDVRRNFALRGRLNGGHITEPRWAPASSGVDPVEYDTYGAEVGANWRGGRYLLDGSAGYNEQNFNTQTYRDATETFVDGRASYALSPDVAVFVQGRRSEYNFDSSNRDSTRTNAQVGASFELAAPFRGEVAVGYVQEDKKDPTLSDFDGLSANGRLMWFPTQLTTLTFSAERSVFDPGLLNAATASNTRFGVRADHELRRNIVLFGEVYGGAIDFQGYDRKDDTVDLGLGAIYKLNRNMHLQSSYRLHTQSSSGVFADRDIEQNIFSIGLTIYP
jgi:hypothetical protein